MEEKFITFGGVDDKIKTAQVDVGSLEEKIEAANQEYLANEVVLSDALAQRQVLKDRLNTLIIFKEQL